jgi:heterodisulfide reductase subunit B
MDRLLGWAGVESLDWPGKVVCCGAHFSMIKPDIVVEMCTKLIAWAQEAGAQAIVVACPMCHANLDTRQEEIAEKLGQPTGLPILYFSQVLGYAIGIEPNALGFNKHLVDPLPLMLEKCHYSQDISSSLHEVAR